MVRIYYLFAALAFAAPALADDAPPKPPDTPAYVPISVNEQMFATLKSYLGEQPAKIATPLLHALDQWEFQARAQWQADHAPKPADRPSAESEAKPGAVK